MSRVTQAALVLNRLQQGPATMWDLTDGLRILRPGARIFELRKKYEITSEMQEVQGRRVAVYIYQGPKNEQSPAPCVPPRSSGQYRATCMECGTRFNSNRKHAKFCNTTCRTAHWKRQKNIQAIEAQQSLVFCDELHAAELERRA